MNYIWQDLLRTVYILGGGQRPKKKFLSEFQCIRPSVKCFRIKAGNTLLGGPLLLIYIFIYLSIFY